MAAGGLPVLGPAGHMGAGEALHMGLGLKWRKTEPRSLTHFCNLDLCSALLTLNWYVILCEPWRGPHIRGLREGDTITPVLLGRTQRWGVPGGGNEVTCRSPGSHWGQPLCTSQSSSCPG